MKSFTVAIFLLFAQATFAEVTKPDYRKPKYEMSSPSNMSIATTVLAKSHKTAKSKAGKKKKKPIVAVDTNFMSYAILTGTDPSSSEDPLMPKNHSSPAMSMPVNDPSPSEDPPMAKSQKNPSSPHTSKGAEKKKSSADGASTPKAKQSAKSKSKDSESGKKLQKGSESGKGSQKSSEVTKMVRSSLPELSAVDSEQEQEQANTLARANTDSSASAYGTTATIVVAMSFVLGGAFIAA